MSSRVDYEADAGDDFSASEGASENSGLMSAYSNTTFYDSDQEDTRTDAQRSNDGLVDEKDKRWKYTPYRQEGNMHIAGEWTFRSEAFRLMVIGPDVMYSFATLCLIVIPSMLMYKYVVEKAIANIVYTCLFVLCLGSFIGVFISDPGLLRKYNHARSAKWTYCDHCESFRPPGCVHCSSCRVCISDYDHHCPWTGKCVGGGNMYWFKAFTISLTWLIIACFTIVVLWATTLE
jgi:hypothetical protein